MWSLYPKSCVILSTTTTTTFVILILLLITTIKSTAQSTERCRCIAKFEHFYDDDRRSRRSRGLLSYQQQQQQQHHIERNLALKIFVYDYTNYYIDRNGYYVVENVTVLPMDDPLCSNNNNVNDYRTKTANARIGNFDDSTTTKTTNIFIGNNNDKVTTSRTGILGRVFGSGRRTLSAIDNTNSQDEYETNDIVVSNNNNERSYHEQRKVPGMGSMKSSGKTSYDQKGKSQGKGGMMTMGKGKGIYCTATDTSPECLPDIFPCRSSGPSESPSESPSTLVPTLNTIPTTCPDGSPAPLNPNNCTVLCPNDGSFFQGCRTPCPTDGSTRPNNCVDICLGRSNDTTNCVYACCFITKPPTSNPTTKKPTRTPTRFPTKSPITVNTTAFPTTLVPTAMVVLTCTNDTDCFDNNICNGIEVCNVTAGICTTGTPLDCNDNNLCTIDTCNATTGSCIHTPVKCNANDACNIRDGTCVNATTVRPCISVIDESDSYTDDEINDKWYKFRKNWPNRPFCLLQPLNPSYSGLFIPTTPDFRNDTLTKYAIVNRDNGDPALASDWLGLCGYRNISFEFLGLFIDDSGSMTVDTVQASFDKLDADLSQANLTYCSVFNPSEDWITPFDTLLGSIGGGGACDMP